MGSISLNALSDWAIEDLLQAYNHNNFTTEQIDKLRQVIQTAGLEHVVTITETQSTRQPNRSHLQINWQTNNQEQMKIINGIGKYINKEAFCYAETGQLRALASELICSNAWFFRCSRAR